jgi:hypothetical protein
MTGSLLKRMEKVEKLMNPPEAPQMPRIVVVFINPDGTVAGRRIIGPGVNEVVEDDDDDETG